MGYRIVFRCVVCGIEAHVSEDHEVCQAEHKRMRDRLCDECADKPLLKWIALQAQASEE